MTKPNTNRVKYTIEFKLDRATRRYWPHACCRRPFTGHVRPNAVQLDQSSSPRQA